MKKEEDNFVKFCPKCYSRELHIYNPPLGGQRPRARTSGGNFYKCDNCGFISSTFPEGHPDDIPEIRRVSDEEKKEWYKRKGTSKKHKRRVSLFFLTLFATGYFFIDHQESKLFFGILSGVMLLSLLLTIMDNRIKPERKK